MPLLQIENLVTSFATSEGVVRAVDGVSFAIEPGQTVGLVGESGSGKSVTALSILRLLREPPAKIESGSIRFRGEDLLAKNERDMRRVRGDQIAMIFQEPMTSLNPVYTIGDQIAEVLTLHRGMKKKAALLEAVSLLERVGIADAQTRVEEYPHQMSGGMRQRVMIAMALACRPALLIADEPTTALDVTIQAQILELLASVQKELEMAVLLITHDLGIVAETCDDVVVMYAGQVVEHARARALFAQPRHPYTEGLLRSAPTFGENAGDKGRLREIPGMVPRLDQLPPGCRFADRCEYADERCREQLPVLAPLVSDAARLSRCFYPVGAVES